MQRERQAKEKQTDSAQSIVQQRLQPEEIDYDRGVKVDKKGYQTE